jgi:glycosyltransferase involved in cell wall biosynthesis
MISVIILCRNEVNTLDVCLSSLRWATEVIVLDSGSTDGSLKIIEKYPNAQCIQVNWEGYGKTKKQGLNHAKYSWILWIDADESLDEDLITQIPKVLQDPKAFAYQLNRKNFFLGKFIRFAGWYPDQIIRLFHRDHWSFSEDAVHEKVVPLSDHKETLSISGHILHQTYRTPEQFIDKIVLYAHLKTQQQPSSSLFWKPCFGFIKSYFFQLGFLEGRRGIMIALGKFTDYFIRGVLYHKD